MTAKIENLLVSFRNRCFEAGALCDYIPGDMEEEKKYRIAYAAVESARAKLNAAIDEEIAK